MEQNLFRYIWSHSKRQQIWILIVVALSMPTYFLAFDIPKLIVNGPIQGRGFESPDATQKVLPIQIGNPFGDQSFTLFSGFDLDRMDDDDNRLFGITAQIAWTPKPSYQLTLRTPLYAIKN